MANQASMHVSSGDQDAIISEIYIAAAPERVFRALVDSHQVLQGGANRECTGAPNSAPTSALEESGTAPALARTAVRSTLPASIWRWIRRGCSYTPGSQAGPATRRQQSAGSWSPKMAARCCGWSTADSPRIPASAGAIAVGRECWDGFRLCWRRAKPSTPARRHKPWSSKLVGGEKKTSCPKP